MPRRKSSIEDTENMIMYTLSTDERRTQRLVMEVYYDNGNMVDEEFTVHIMDPVSGEVYEMNATDNPFIVEGLRPYKHYTVWVTIGDEMASYPTDVYLYRTGGKIILPPGCHVSKEQMPGSDAHYKIVVGNREFLFLVQSKDLRPVQGTIVLENYYTGEQIIAGETDDRGRLRVQLPYGRYYVSVMADGVYDLGSTIRVKPRWRPLLLIILPE